MKRWLLAFNGSLSRALVGGAATGAATGLVLIAYWLFAGATDGQVQRLGALLTPAVAMLALAIGYGQWRIAQNKLKLDLFDRCNKVYMATKEAARGLAVMGELEPDEMRAFFDGVQGANWLFGPLVDNYIGDIQRRLDKMHSFKRMMNQAIREGDGPDLTAVALHSGQKMWFKAQLEDNVLEQVFKPYLMLQH